MHIPFTKMHGLGNDFVLFVESSELKPSFVTPGFVRFVADRHFGVGADQVLVLSKDPFSLLIYNPDGSEAEMCGNGVRATALYIFSHLLKQRLTRFDIKTKGALVECQVRNQDHIELKLDRPRVLEDLSEGGAAWTVTRVDAGNPHAVMIVPSLQQIQVGKLGPQIEHHAYFPQRTNVEFAEVVDRNHVKMKVWERGAGVTLACGSGACSVASCLVAKGLVDSRVTLSMDGGDLQFQVEQEYVRLIGPARIVFSGLIQWPQS